MIKTAEFSAAEGADMLSPVQHIDSEFETAERDVQHTPRWPHLFSQVLRFSMVGGLNTLVDLGILNGLLWLYPTSSIPTLLSYNVLAYSMGAVNSFLLNKYWTFEQKQRTTRGELVRFTVTTLCGIAWSSLILWLASLVFLSLLVNRMVWANASKVIAIGGTALISYLALRLWVFVRSPQRVDPAIRASFQKGSNEALCTHEFAHPKVHLYKIMQAHCLPRIVSLLCCQYTTKKRR